MWNRLRQHLEQAASLLRGIRRKVDAVDCKIFQQDLLRAFAALENTWNRVGPGDPEQGSGLIVRSRKPSGQGGRTT
jgi:hypothetical protein